MTNKPEHYLWPSWQIYFLGSYLYDYLNSKLN